MVPKEWLLADISAIYKKGDKRLPGNYTPVSLTSVACKIMEKFVRNALLQHLKDHNILSKKQFGFLPGRSTLLQLTLVLEEWISALENGAEIDVAFMDFAKAFDKVPHNRLMNTLMHSGIQGNVHRWISSFLTNRKQSLLPWDEIRLATGY